MSPKPETILCKAGAAPYEIRIAPHFAPEDLKTHLAGKNCLIVADSNLAELYLSGIYRLVRDAGAAKVSTMQFPAGESSKHFQTVEEICRTAALRGLDRHSVMLALGGGVTGDMTGFAAAIYMRGIQFLQFPASLLAMVDSSIGGKTGCDLPEGKNLIGAFHQPSGVFAATDFLKTLPENEFRCGMAEVIKTAAVADAEFFEFLERNMQEILAGNAELRTKMIARCCALKAGIVSRDEKESGLRAILNYGHTFGHAVEKESGYMLPHGFAVAIGIVMAGALAVRLGIMKEADAERQKNLLLAANLPVQTDFDAKAVLQTLAHDKKNLNGEFRFVFTPETGSAEIRTVPQESIQEFLSC